MAHQSAQQVKKILWQILLANLFVAIAKVIIGTAIQSASMTADGYHSLTDGASNVVGLIGISLAAKPVDAAHPYGHGKYEFLTSLFIGIMLLIIAGKIGFEAFQRFAEATGRPFPPPSPDVEKGGPAQVTWKEAVDYAAWLSAQTGHSYRLPTEAEWERASRSGAGVQDLAGQEREWTCSEYRQTYEGQEQRCAGRLPEAVAIRGGSWRAGADPLSDDLEFRLVRKP